jgi:hypothetical protein
MNLMPRNSLKVPSFVKVNPFVSKHVMNSSIYFASGAAIYWHCQCTAQSISLSYKRGIGHAGIASVQGQGVPSTNVHTKVEEPHALIPY